MAYHIVNKDSSIEEMIMLRDEFYIQIRLSKGGDAEDLIYEVNKLNALIRIKLKTVTIDLGDGKK